MVLWTKDARLQTRGNKNETGLNFIAKRRFPDVFLAGGEPGMEKWGQIQLP